MSAPKCEHCGDPAPYGFPRNMWLSAHEAWYHRLYWSIKKKLTK